MTCRARCRRRLPGFHKHAPRFFFSFFSTFFVFLFLLLNPPIHPLANAFILLRTRLSATFLFPPLSRVRPILLRASSRRSTQLLPHPCYTLSPSFFSSLSSSSLLHLSRRFRNGWGHRGEESRIVRYLRSRNFANFIRENLFAACLENSVKIYYTFFFLSFAKREDFCVEQMCRK